MDAVDKKCDEIFNAIDNDKSETIDIKEFEAYFNKFKEFVNVSGDFNQVFNEIDSNKDSFLSKQELKDYIQSRLKK